MYMLKKSMHRVPVKDEFYMLMITKLFVDTGYFCVNQI